MKTPVQELFEKLWDNPKDKFTWYAIRKEMLEKEKEVILNAWLDDRFPLDKEWAKQCAEDYYNETFNTKEK